MSGKLVVKRSLFAGLVISIQTFDLSIYVSFT